MERDWYLVKVGLDYPPDNKEPKVRAEPGDIVNNLPTRAAKWMVEIGAVEGPLSAERLAELKGAEG